MHAHNGRVDRLCRRVMRPGGRTHDPGPDACSSPANKMIVARRVRTEFVRRVAPWLPDRRTQTMPLRTRRSFARGTQLACHRNDANAVARTCRVRSDSDGRLVIEPLEVTLIAQTAALAERLKGQSFDLLFLNPGILLRRGVAMSDVPDNDIQNIFLTNAISPIRVADALAHFVAPGGTIAFMSSDMGSIGANDDGRVELYRASKAAV
jgi:NAD(P)-dependent dehydrogenase (short-subunit alcohol dehydrogenase family)